MPPKQHVYLAATTDQLLVRRRVLAIEHDVRDASDARAYHETAHREVEATSDEHTEGGSD